MASPDEYSIIDYVLGWVTPRQRRKIEKRIDSDPALAASVGEWSATLAPLDDLATPVAPPADLWLAVQSRLNAAEAKRPLPLWPWAMGVAAVCAVLAGLWMVTPPRPVYQAELYTTADPAGLAVASIRVDEHDDLHMVAENFPNVSADHSLELWVIPAGGTPRSLGVVTPADVTRHVDGLTPGSSFAITIEPAGGSPTGVATGPVVASGEMKRL
jgi:anti-sigma-K factor RskA